MEPSKVAPLLAAAAYVYRVIAAAPALHRMPLRLSMVMLIETRMAEVAEKSSLASEAPATFLYRHRKLVKDVVESLGGLVDPEADEPAVGSKRGRASLGETSAAGAAKKSPGGGVWCWDCGYPDHLSSKCTNAGKLNVEGRDIVKNGYQRDWSYDRAVAAAARRRSQA